jgi:hypothetical protein
MLLGILENFTKLFESVWSQIAKDIEEIRKQKIRKETAQKKYK